MSEINFKEELNLIKEEIEILKNQNKKLILERLIEHYIIAMENFKEYHEKITQKTMKFENYLQLIENQTTKRYLNYISGYESSIREEYLLKICVLYEKLDVLSPEMESILKQRCCKLLNFVKDIKKFYEKDIDNVLYLYDYTLDDINLWWLF